jgi:hypothetical protein
MNADTFSYIFFCQNLQILTLQNAKTQSNKKNKGSNILLT